MTKLVKTWMSLKTDRKGVTALEYGLIAALVAVAMITGATTLGTNVNKTFNKVATAIGST